MSSLSSKWSNNHSGLTLKNHTSHLECLVYIKYIYIIRNQREHKSTFKSYKHIFYQELDQYSRCNLEKIYLTLGKKYILH